MNFEPVPISDIDEGHNLPQFVEEPEEDEEIPESRD
jgi:hypothetical protein